MIDDSFAVCRRRCRGRFCEKVEDLEARVDLFSVAESRLNEGEGLDVLGNLRDHTEPRPSDGEDPDVLGNPRDRAEPRLSDGEDLDASGDAVEDPNETAVAAGADEDVKDRPVAVVKPIACHNLCDDVLKASATCDSFVTAIY